MNIDTAQNALGVSFQDETLLQRALTHRSYLNENPSYPFEDNERLEFLGDAIIDFVVGEFLYHRFPDIKEGELTSRRSALVRTEMLASFAQKIDLGLYLLMGKGEEETGGRQREGLLCGAFEALVGALYLDNGLESIRKLVLPFVESQIENIVRTQSHHDAKSAFQELAQGEKKITPIYKTIEESGPDHAKIFTVATYLDSEEYGRGTGTNKQRAAQDAAHAAIAKLEAETQKKGK